MNAPMIWVGIPAAAAVLLFLLRGFRSLVYALGILFGGWLWSLALMLPIGELAAVGGRTFRIGDAIIVGDAARESERKDQIDRSFGCGVPVPGSIRISALRAYRPACQPRLLAERADYAVSGSADEDSVKDLCHG